VQKDGYASKRITKLDAREALNIQEIKLYPIQQKAQSGQI
jgi:hypothetical protein